MRRNTRYHHYRAAIAAVLTAALMQTFGALAAEFTTTNYALAGTATASSAGFGSTPERVIDGNTSGNWGDNSVWHANSADDGPTYWEVELDATHEIGRVNVYLRTDCCGERNANLEVVLFDEGHNEIYRELHAQNPFSLSPPQTKFGVNLVPPVGARFVRIERTQPYNDSYMHLAEVEALAPYANSSIAVVAAAQDTETTEGRTATLGPVAATVTGAPQEDLNIQWQLNGVDIPGATGTTFTTPILSLADSGSEYTARFTIAGVSTTTKAKVTVLKDDVAPTVVSASAIGQTVGIAFNELLNETSATNITHYTGIGGVTVTRASLLPGGKTVALTVTGLSGNTFSIQIVGVTDFGGTPVAVGTVATGSIDSSLTIEDIGTPEAPGVVASVVAGTYVFYATGKAGDPYADSDQRNFGHSTVVGDFDKRVKVTAMEATTPADFWARGGIEARTSIEPNARAVAIITSNPLGANQVGGLARADEGPLGPTASGWNWVGRNLGGVKEALPNQWLRLRRIGDSFFFYVGTNGSAWTLIGKKYMVDLPDELEVGLFAAGNTAESTVAVSYENYSNVTLADTLKPTLISVGTIDKVKVGVKFSEPVSSLTAGVAGNYTLSQGTVTSAEVGAEGDSVYLTVDGLSSDTFTVAVKNITDTAGNIIEGNPSVSGNVSPWTIARVGKIVDPSQPPSEDNLWINPAFDPIAVATTSSNLVNVEVIGSGGDIWNDGDYMHYLYQPKAGDFDVQVEVTRNDLSNGRGGYSHGGLMARASLYTEGQEYTGAGTKVLDVMNTTYSEGGQARTAIVIWRDSVGAGYGNSAPVDTSTQQDGVIGRFADLRAADASGNVLPQTSPVANRWLRLKRVGNEFISYWSYFGKDWVEYNRHTIDAMPTDIFVGYAAQDNSSEGAQGKPGQYMVSALRSLGDVPQGLVLTLGGTTVAPTLSWGDATAVLESAPTINGPWAPVAGAVSPYALTGSSTAFFRLSK